MNYSAVIVALLWLGVAITTIGFLYLAWNNEVPGNAPMYAFSFGGVLALGIFYAVKEFFKICLTIIELGD